MKSHLLSIAVLATVLSAIGLIFSQPTLAQSTAPASNELKSSVPLRDALAQTEPIKITGVKISPKDNGIEISIENAAGTTFTQPLTQTQDKTSTTDIPNAVLALPDATAVKTDNPTPGIANISVTQISPTVVRVVITGSDKLPESKVVITDRGLMITSTPAPITAQEDDAELEITVVGLRNRRGYNSLPNSTTATKTDTPIQDIPGSIRILPPEVLRDQGAVRVDDAVRNVSGVNVTNSIGGRRANFNTRGFNASQFRNGFGDDGRTRRTAADTANIERIEVVKGPASGLFGAADPAGVINIVTQRPLAQDASTADLTVANYGFYRQGIDISQSLGRDVAYRLNGAIESNRTFRDNAAQNRFVIAPVIEWKVGPNTKLTFEADLLYDKRPIDRGLVAVGNRPANIPISRFLGPGAKPHTINEERYYTYFDHQFNPDLTLRSVLNAARTAELRPLGEQANRLRPDNRTLEMRSSASDSLYESFTFQNDLNSKFNTGSIKHNVLLGVEIDKQTELSYNNREGITRTIDIFAPVFNPIPAAIVLRPTPEAASNTEANTIGIYLQDQITLFDNLKLLVGARFDTYNDRVRFPLAPTRNSSTQAQAFSPRVGLVYQPIQPISLYANYSNSFLPQGGLSAAGTSFQPQRGTQYEAGVKSEFFGGRLSTTLAAYQITKANVLTADPNNATFSIQTGEQSSQGFELDVVGEIAPGWDLIATFANTKAEISKDNTFTVGNRLNNVPSNTASFWTNYRFQSGALKGFGIGAGAFFVDGRMGDLANSFELPGYTRVDAAISYAKDDFRAALNFKNLLDLRYFDGSQNRTTINPGAPFTIQGTVSYTF